MKYKIALILAVTISAAHIAASDSGPVDRDLLPIELPGSAMPVVHEHTYKMAGRVRMLLLWIGRDDVGSGLIHWRKDGDSIAYDLLIGSDPLRAPGKLNRWGYLAEEVQGGECSVVGVMSKSSEEGLGQVKADIRNGTPARPFDTIRGRVTTHQAFARVTTVHASSSVTYREADAVLGLTLGDGSNGIKQIDRPSGVRPGFLSSMAEVIHQTVDAETHGRRSAPRTLPYVYGDRVYELRVLDVSPIARFEHAGKTYEHVIRGRFETGRQGRAGSRFELVYATRGALAEIPILIAYQPKWWLQVELTLES